MERLTIPCSDTPTDHITLASAGSEAAISVYENGDTSNVFLDRASAIRLRDWIDGWLNED